MKRARSIKKAKGKFEGVMLVELPKEVAISRGIDRWLSLSACAWGHWVSRSINGTCPICMIERRQRDWPKYILNRVKAAAKARGLEFNLDESDITIPKYCPLLGIPIIKNVGGGFGSGRGGKKKSENGPSVDRLDPNKGYVKGNVWVISNKANRMKQDLSIEDMKRFIAAIEKKIQESEV